MCTRPSRRASIKESLGCLIALSMGLACGAGGIAWATVACGSLDSTSIDLIAVRKGGTDQPLPMRRSTSIENNGIAVVYDPDRGEFRELFLERLP